MKPEPSKKDFCLPAGCLAIVLFLLVSPGVKSQDSLLIREPVTLSVYGGVYSILDMWATTGYADIRVIPPWKVWVLRPQAGFLAAFDGSCLAYAGLVWPAVPVRWLVIETGAAAGYYIPGRGVNLAFPLEFRLSLAVLYRFRNFIHLGVECAHISNANLGPPNPGTESVAFVFRLPLSGW